MADRLHHNAILGRAKSGFLKNGGVLFEALPDHPSNIQTHYEFIGNPDDQFESFFQLRVFRQDPEGHRIGGARYFEIKVTEKI